MLAMISKKQNPADLCSQVRLILGLNTQHFSNRKLGGMLVKILRTKGVSFSKNATTERTMDEKDLQRGLRVNSKADPARAEISPEELAQYVGEEPALALRQTISVLDKVVRKPFKPASLRGFERSAYEDRSLIAVHLWELLKEKWKRDIRCSPGGEDAFAMFEEIWWAKVHPYAKHKMDPKNPGADRNAIYICERGDGDKNREDFRGRWHKAFWITNAGRPDHKAIAKAIWNHLWDQEIKIDGEPRTKDSHTPTGVGLVHSRGRAMSNSARDPRTKRKRVYTWEDKHEQIYFAEDKGKDIASTIFEDAISTNRKNERFRSDWFGQRLSAHFEGVGKRCNFQTEKEHLWALHNAVRKFYRKLSRSDRFRVAWNAIDDGGAGLEKLKALLPENGPALMRAISATSRNASISELIRIGKLLVHASDIDVDEGNVSNTINNRMDYLATSDGQSEIKRNEAFTRVWRQAVGQSFRTLRAWADPHDQAKIGRDEDLATADVSRTAVRQADLSHIRKHASLVFGEKDLSAHPGKNRASLFALEDDELCREVLWAMLRLASELRHRTNHFNTKRRLTKVVSNGVLQKLPDQRGQNFNGGKSFEADPRALQVFDDLLDFDRKLNAQRIVDTLNQARFTHYANGGRVRVRRHGF